MRKLPCPAPPLSTGERIAMLLPGVHLDVDARRLIQDFGGAVSGGIRDKTRFDHGSRAGIVGAPITPHFNRGEPSRS
jgi:hypothetical protein